MSAVSFPVSGLPLSFSVVLSRHRFSPLLFNFQVPGLGHQVSGTGVQVQVQENPVPEPGADDQNLRPDGWDLRPENELAQAPALALALNYSAIDSVLCHRLSHLSSAVSFLTNGYEPTPSSV